MEGEVSEVSKVGGSNTETKSVERPKVLSEESLKEFENGELKEALGKALIAFRAKELSIYRGLESDRNSKAMYRQKCKTHEELKSSWKLDPLYWSQIRTFIEGHPELKYYQLNDGMLTLKPPVSTLKGVTTVFNTDKLTIEVASAIANKLGLSEEQADSLVKLLDAFDKEHKRNNFYQRKTFNKQIETPEDVQARRKSLLETEAERITKEWKDAEQKQMDEQIAQELAQREKEESRLNAEKQAESRKKAANVARYGMTIENLKKKELK
jgi:hypothetical protein